MFWFVDQENGQLILNKDKQRHLGGREGGRRGGREDREVEVDLNHAQSTHRATSFTHQCSGNESSKTRQNTDSAVKRVYKPRPTSCISEVVQRSVARLVPRGNFKRFHGDHVPGQVGNKHHGSNGHKHAKVTN